MLIYSCHAQSKFYGDGLLPIFSGWYSAKISASRIFSADFRRTEIRRLIRISAAAGGSKYDVKCCWCVCMCVQRATATTLDHTECHVINKLANVIVARRSTVWRATSANQTSTTIPSVKVRTAPCVPAIPSCTAPTVHVPFVKVLITMLITSSRKNQEVASNYYHAWRSD